AGSSGRADGRRTPNRRHPYRSGEPDAPSLPNVPPDAAGSIRAPGPAREEPEKPSVDARRAADEMRLGLRGPISPVVRWAGTAQYARSGRQPPSRGPTMDERASQAWTPAGRPT